MIPQLELPLALQLVGIIITISGVYFTLRFSLREVKSDNTENKRLLNALHRRFGNLEEIVTAGRIKTAVLEAKISNIEKENK
jgi:hypothetical protein